VLLVDEEGDVRKGLATALRDAGLVVGEAGSCTHALRAARRTKPELVVLARRLPDGDGWEVARELRARERGLDAFVIAIHESGHPSVVERALGAGADAFLERACDPDVLVSHVRRLLALRPPPTGVRKKRGL
jgi:two-component system, NarL family, response regulator DevR